MRVGEAVVAPRRVFGLRVAQVLLDRERDVPDVVERLEVVRRRDAGLGELASEERDRNVEDLADEVTETLLLECLQLFRIHRLDLGVPELLLRDRVAAVPESRGRSSACLLLTVGTLSGTVPGDDGSAVADGGVSRGRGPGRPCDRAGQVPGDGAVRERRFASICGEGRGRARR